MHDDIKRFEREGYTDNSAKTREWMIDDLEREMRDAGYVPSIDNYPQYTVDFLNDKEGFYFTLSCYGIYVGEEESWQVSGMTVGKKIMKPTPPAKSSQS